MLRLQAVRSVGVVLQLPCSCLTGSVCLLPSPGEPTIAPVPGTTLGLLQVRRA